MILSSLQETMEVLFTCTVTWWFATLQILLLGALWVVLLTSPGEDELWSRKRVWLGPASLRDRSFLEVTWKWTEITTQIKVYGIDLLMELIDRSIDR